MGEFLSEDQKARIHFVPCKQCRRLEMKYKTTTKMGDGRHIYVNSAGMRWKGNYCPACTQKRVAIKNQKYRDLKLGVGI